MYKILLFFLIFNINIFKKCIKGCKKCFDDKINSCYELEESYYYDEKENKIKNCKVNNCQNCDNNIILKHNDNSNLLNKNNECTKCKIGYTPIYLNEFIIKECKSLNHLKKNKICINCKETSNCESCKLNKNCKNKNECKICKNCDSCNNCKNIVKRNIEYCSEYDFKKDKCTFCLPGYYLNVTENICHPFNNKNKEKCIENCEICHDNNICFKAKLSYYLDKIKNKIYKCSDENCLSCFENKNICSICKDGFYMSLDKNKIDEKFKCKRCNKNNCALCNGLDPNNCTKCFLGYNLHINYIDINELDRERKSEILLNDYPELRSLSFWENNIVSHLQKHKCSKNNCENGYNHYGICYNKHYSDEELKKKHVKQNLEELNGHNDFDVSKLEDLNFNSREIIEEL